MNRRRRLRGLWCLAGAILVLLALAPAPANAHSRVFITGTFGVPFYGYPFSYPYYPYYPAPYPVYVAPSVPPPGWDPGHWEYRHDPWGRNVPVWVPEHLR